MTAWNMLEDCEALDKWIKSSGDGLVWSASAEYVAFPGFLQNFPRFLMYTMLLLLSLGQFTNSLLAFHLIFSRLHRCKPMASSLS